jgi:hypothetical protein
VEIKKSCNSCIPTQKKINEGVHLRPVNAESAALDQLRDDRILLKLSSAPRQRFVCERQRRNLGRRIVRFVEIKSPYIPAKTRSGGWGVLMASEAHRGGKLALK